MRAPRTTDPQFFTDLDRPARSLRTPIGDRGVTNPGLCGKNVVGQRNGIIALGLLTAGDVAKLGSDFARIYPVDETPCFGGLLRAIDEADRALRRERGR